MPHYAAYAEFHLGLHRLLKYWYWERVNPYKPIVLFVDIGKPNRADPDQTPHNAASDQGVHCLLTECSIRI